MASLAQALQGAPEPAPQAHIVAVVSATTTTIQTAGGPVVNATGLALAAGRRVVVWRVQGLQVAICALP